MNNVTYTLRTKNGTVAKAIPKEYVMNLVDALIDGLCDEITISKTENGLEESTDMGDPKNISKAKHIKEAFKRNVKKDDGIKINSDDLDKITFLSEEDHVQLIDLHLSQLDGLNRVYKNSLLRIADHTNHIKNSDNIYLKVNEKVLSLLKDFSEITNTPISITNRYISSEEGMYHKLKYHHVIKFINRDVGTNLTSVRMPNPNNSDDPEDKKRLMAVLDKFIYEHNVIDIIDVGSDIRIIYVDASREICKVVHNLHESIKDIRPNPLIWETVKEAINSCDEYMEHEDTMINTYLSHKLS